MKYTSPTLKLLFWRPGDPDLSLHAELLHGTNCKLSLGAEV